MSSLRALSMYGWISVALCGLLVAVFNEQSINNYWTNVVTKYNNDATVVDDNNFGVSDKCYPSFFPAHKWFIILNYGVCFDTKPDNYSTGITEVFVSGGSSSGKKSKYCWSWDHVDADGERFWSSSGTMGTVCKALKGSVNNDDINSPQDISILNCNDWEEHANLYQITFKIGKAGIAFGTIAGFLGLVGGFTPMTKVNKAALQGVAGFSFMISCILSLCQIIANAKPGNPFRILNNNMAFGCLPGWLNGYTLLHVQDNIGGGMVLCYTSMILALTIGGICLTTKSCYIKGCCPCCFGIEEGEEPKNFIAHYVDNNMNTFAVSRGSL